MRCYVNDLGDPNFEVPILGFEKRCCGSKGLRESDTMAYWTDIRAPWLALSPKTLTDTSSPGQSECRRLCRDVS